MAYQMAQIPMTSSESESHFCCYEWQIASRGPSATAELLVFIKPLSKHYRICNSVR